MSILAPLLMFLSPLMVWLLMTYILVFFVLVNTWDFDILMQEVYIQNGSA